MLHYYYYYYYYYYYDDDDDIQSMEARSPGWECTVDLPEWKKHL